jgi:class 3 adenylate cyclase
MQISRQYRFEFSHPVETLWSIVSDTARWGEASGFPKYQTREELQADGRVSIYGTVYLAGFKITWEEAPANWISPHWFEQKRTTFKGPIAEMTTSATLDDQHEHSRLKIELRFEVRNLAGKFIAKRMLAAYQNKIEGMLADADRLIREEQADLFISRYRPSTSAIQRAQQIGRQIAETPYEHGLVQKLIDFILSRQEVDLWSIRPLAIARRWRVSPRKVAELFLQSVRAGLLESRWDILCPRCRVSNTHSSNMSDLPKGVHCEACNIDFQTEFARNVELSFSPSPVIRQIEYGHYCRSGPGVTPHIKGQCSLKPGESQSFPLLLSHGEYRLRTLEAGDEISFCWSQDNFPHIRVQDEKVEIDGESPPGEIRMTNLGRYHRTVVIEELNWMTDILTAEQVMTMQAFRDLFSDQVLRPGDEVSIRNISFMFTDLVNSSAIFRHLGDAEAYHLVREHFSDLNEIVREHEGSIVKTIGDGIHAAFLVPENALRAAIAIQQAMPAFNQRMKLDNIAIRIGLHFGNSIAVTLNGRLDYYGEVVNLAARLEGLGDSGDITMSKIFSDDPAITEILRDYKLQHKQVSVKGAFEPASIVQISTSQTV